VVIIHPYGARVKPLHTPNYISRSRIKPKNIAIEAAFLLQPENKRNNEIR
jgi:hypothetical protein